MIFAVVLAYLRTSRSADEPPSASMNLVGHVLTSIACRTMPNGSRKYLARFDSEWSELKRAGWVGRDS